MGGLPGRSYALVFGQENRIDSVKHTGMFKLKHKLEGVCMTSFAVLDQQKLCAISGRVRPSGKPGRELILYDYLENVVIKRHQIAAEDEYYSAYTTATGGILTVTKKSMELFSSDLDLLESRTFSGVVYGDFFSERYAIALLEERYETLHGFGKRRALVDSGNINLVYALPDGGPFHVSGSIAYMAYVSPERRSKLFAYDFLSKTILWEYEANGSWFFVGAGKNALCFKLKRTVNDEDTWDVLCLDAQTGEKKWELFDKHRDLRVYEERNEFIQVPFFEAYDIATGELKRKQPGTNREISAKMPMWNGHNDAQFIDDHIICTQADIVNSAQTVGSTFMGAFNIETFEFDWFQRELGTWMLGSGSMQYKFGHLFIHDNENTLYIYERDENWWQEYEKRKRGDGISDTLPPPQLR